MDSKIQDLLESELKDRDYPDFETGDTISVFTREEIGGQMRDRKFEGVCISRDGKGPDQTFKVRKDSFGVGVERIFPLYSPMIKDIKVERKGKVRQAKLNYLEERSQKDARIEEERVDLDEINRVGSEEEETEEVSDDVDEDEQDVDESEDVEESAEEAETSEDETVTEQSKETDGDDDAGESEEAESDAESDNSEQNPEAEDADDTPEETAEDADAESEEENEDTPDEQPEVDEDSPSEEKEEIGESV